MINSDGDNDNSDDHGHLSGVNEPLEPMTKVDKN